MRTRPAMGEETVRRPSRCYQNEESARFTNDAQSLNASVEEGGRTFPPVDPVGHELHRLDPHPPELLPPSPLPKDKDARPRTRSVLSLSLLTRALDLRPRC